MQNNSIVGIFITAEKGAEMVAVNDIIAVANQGLIGDRYYSSFSKLSNSTTEPNQEVTLIESESFETLASEHGINLEYSQSRRNIVTREVDLNSLVGKKFKIGEVVLLGMELCEPCRYLSEMTDCPNLVKQWLHKAGLRAHIVKGGHIKVNDSILFDF